ncbi:MAG: PilT/PilU family type 4a pilus ATPase [Oscillospiraceae bacterium]|nr:PilT/PilU family type 4a pilus ATPase [Oscillospiraceae bacterium]
MAVIEFGDLVMTGREYGASDIHLTVSKPPVFRIDGGLVLIEEFADALIPNRTILSVLNARQEELLNEGEDLDFVIELENGCRQRVNVFRQMGRLACSIRLLNSEIRSIEELKLPPVIAELAMKKKGIILVTGATGSGKTTTLSSIVDYINSNRSCHIITIEDPVEYRYKAKKSLIHQREIGVDVKNFNSALRSALREDPDVIFIGEMRDYESIQLAITAAETGHLVLATLHTNGACHTVNRIVDACPPEVREQMITQVSQILEGIISQALLPLEDGSGRIAALEILVGTDAVKNIIRSNKSHQLETSMQSGAKFGMVTMDDCISGYYRKGMISRNTALEYANDKTAMANKIGVGNF